MGGSGTGSLMEAATRVLAGVIVIQSQLGKDLLPSSFMSGLAEAPFQCSCIAICKPPKRCLQVHSHGSAQGCLTMAIGFSERYTRESKKEYAGENHNLFII